MDCHFYRAFLRRLKADHKRAVTDIPQKRPVLIGRKLYEWQNHGDFRFPALKIKFPGTFPAPLSRQLIAIYQEAIERFLASWNKRFGGSMT